MSEPRSLEELVEHLDNCDITIRSDACRGLEMAEQAVVFLEGMDLSRYLRRNLEMRTRGCLGDALAASAQRTRAAEAFQRAKELSGSRTERASLAIRLARFYSAERRWKDALGEAGLAVEHFRVQRPRRETDLRSLSGALVARGNVLFTSHLEGVELLPHGSPWEQAGRDYRSALSFSSIRTDFCAAAAVSNLANLSLRCWWEHNDRIIEPSDLASKLRGVCTSLSKKGIRHGSPTHAKARALYGLASAEAYGSLNRSNEARLERAFHDLLEASAMDDAASLALDMSFWYLRESRSDDMMTTMTTVLHHPDAGSLPATWQQALRIWVGAIENRNVARQVIVETFKTIRGFSPRWSEAEDLPLPKSRYGDRSDTLGF